MPFDRVPTPVELLTPQERQMKQAGESLEQTAAAFVDEEVTQPTPLNLSLNEAEPAEQSESKPTDTSPEDAEAVLAQKAKEAREARLKELKEDEEIVASRDAFLLEISGLLPYTKTYRIANFIEVTFSTIDADSHRQINGQSICDLTQNRIRSRHPMEMQNVAFEYRLAASTDSFRVLDPKTGQVKRQYSRGDAVDTAKLIESTRLTSIDYPVRALWLYLSDEVLQTQSLSRIVRQWFEQFEQHILDMLDLLELDPSFFTDEA